MEELDEKREVTLIGEVASFLADEEFIPFESSPVQGWSLEKIVRLASKNSGAFTGAYFTYLAAHGHDGLALLVLVPAGIVICGVARGLATGLEEVIRSQLQRFVRPYTEPPRLEKRGSKSQSKPKKAHKSRTQETPKKKANKTREEASDPESQEEVSLFGVMAPGVFAVMAPLETSNSRVRTGIKVA
jgi:hypothetical protein